MRVSSSIHHAAIHEPLQNKNISEHCVVVLFDGRVIRPAIAGEAYPNCGVYSGRTGGPVAGGPSVYGGIAAGCMRKPKPGEHWTGVPPDCVYEGTALPAPPFQVSL
jgi:hypothetical protein